jgi:uncharacterized protein YxjI
LLFAAGSAYDGGVSKNIEVTQRLMAVSAQYDVAVEGEAAEPHFTVRGEFMTTTPTLQLFDKASKLAATLKGNVLKTKFQIKDEKNQDLASLNFHAVAFRKTFTMTVGSKGYHANAGVVGVVKDIFECKDNEGKIALVVSKEPGIRDRFKIELREERDVPFEVAVLAAVALHSRFYE